MPPSLSRIAALGAALWCIAPAGAAPDAVSGRGDTLHAVLTEAPRYLRSEHHYVIPDAILTDAWGKSISLAQELAAEGPVMVNFIYTRCASPCLVMTEAFAELQRQLGHEPTRLRLFSISSDPDYDTTARMRAYAKSYEPAPGWMLLTGRAAEIVPVQQAFEVFGSNREEHAAVTFLRAGPQAPWVRVDGLVSGSELAAEYRSTVGLD